MICVFVTYNQKCSSVFFYVMVSQVQPQEEIQERYKETNFIILTGLERGVMSCHTGLQGKHWNLGFIFKQKTRKRGKLKLEPFCSFCGKDKAAQGKQSRIGWFE